ncbi:hypothetical protein, partial [Citrobacter freundii]|uniref:hypothetical protein n=1 Tax=Citrobacter freundii TaxID=546 RepID=UPI0019CF7913
KTITLLEQGWSLLMMNLSKKIAAVAANMIIVLLILQINVRFSFKDISYASFTLNLIKTSYRKRSFIMSLRSWQRPFSISIN